MQRLYDDGGRNNMVRIGHGYDAHRFADDSLPLDESLSIADIADVSLSIEDNSSMDEGSGLINNDSHIVIGGVEIPHSRALRAHSDGDVLIHALCDALLGSLALGDIGKHFPDTAAELENIDSRILLRKVMQFVFAAQYKISNVDMIIIAQAPKMAPHIELMRALLADDLDINLSQINIKATTTEQMGFTGREEGIAAHAVVCVQSSVQDNSLQDKA